MVAAVSFFLFRISGQQIGAAEWRCWPENPKRRKREWQRSCAHSQSLTTSKFLSLCIYYVVVSKLWARTLSFFSFTFSAQDSPWWPRSGWRSPGLGAEERKRRREWRPHLNSWASHTKIRERHAQPLDATPFTKTCAPWLDYKFLSSSLLCESSHGPSLCSRINFLFTEWRDFLFLLIFARQFRDGQKICVNTFSDSFFLFFWTGP